MRTHKTLCDWGVIAAFGTLAISFAGCSHGPIAHENDPAALLDQVCRPGAGVKAARGSVWLKAKSKDASGQFPALVEAPSADRLKLEVTNLVGGTEAIISVEGQHYRIDIPNHKERQEQGNSSWGGIPLQWANALFLGRIPCPELPLAAAGSVNRDAQGALVVETSKTLDRMAEKYVYHLTLVGGTSWADSLHWERKGMDAADTSVVDFKFSDPDDKTRSPQKWEAKGGQGEVKVRWKDRQFER